jgi:hypothetical protein
VNNNNNHHNNTKTLPGIDHLRLETDSQMTENSAPEKKLSPGTIKSFSLFQESSNAILKQFQILAKGHNETYEIVNPMNYARFLTVSVGEHVSENGGT